MAKPPEEAELVVADSSSTGPSSDIKERARDLYMQHKSASDISRELGITARQLARWRTDEQWSLAREAEDRSLIEDGFGSRRVTLSKLATLTADQLKRGLEHLARRHDPPNLSELDKLSTIITNLDRIGRLDANKSTDNLAVNASLKLSVDEIKSIIKADPFSEPEE